MEAIILLLLGFTAHDILVDINAFCLAVMSKAIRVKCWLNENYLAESFK